jgi:hypothetical protein
VGSRSTIPIYEVETASAMANPSACERQFIASDEPCIIAGLIRELSPEEHAKAGIPEARFMNTPPSVPIPKFVAVAESRFELRNRKDTGKPIDPVWLWFRSPPDEPGGRNDTDF